MLLGARNCRVCDLLFVFVLALERGAVPDEPDDEEDDKEAKDVAEDDSDKPDAVIASS